MTSQLSRFSRAAASVAASAMLGTFLAAPAQSQTVAALSAGRPVGEITMAVGQAMKTSLSGVPEPVTRGTQILPGDRLDTGAGGHVHVRFVDGGMLSVRPGSRLWIEDYRYDPSQVSQSLVRFRLDQGVARSISGAAAQGAKERFRLNTPLVAIGVRGTDFVVRSAADATLALVNQGAIVMAPFGEGCSAQALGPCGSPSAKLLSADMGPLLMEFRTQLAQPELKPLRAVSGLGESAEGADPSGRPPASGNRGTRPGATQEETVTAVLVHDVVQSAGDSKPSQPSTPPPPVVVAEPAALAWGRWGGASALPGDISVPRAEAADGRAVTVGDLQYVLYRSKDGTVLSPGMGAYAFDLQQSSAQFSAPGQALMAAAVQSGQLAIDFGTRRFTTNLNVNSAATGTVNLAGSGLVRDDGIFNDRSIAGQAIAGAATLNGKSAGYLFEKAVGAGTLSGITLWSRK